MKLKEAESWETFDGGDCNKCGSSPVEVLTLSKKKNWVYDEDDVRCTECGNTGSIIVDDETASVVWDDEKED